MKDFTTSKYIAPIIDEISGKYFIDNPDVNTRSFLHCDLILESPEEIGTVYTVSRKREFYIPGIDSIKSLINEVSDYTLCAQTYDGELDQWLNNEIDRIYNAIRDALINKYGVKNNEY